MQGRRADGFESSPRERRGDAVRRQQAGNGMRRRSCRADGEPRGERRNSMRLLTGRRDGRVG